MLNEYYTLTCDLLSYLRQEKHFDAVAPASHPPSVLVKDVKPKESPKETDEPIRQRVSPPPVQNKGEDDSSIRQLIAHHLPELKLRDQIPSDEKAKALAQFYKENAPHVALLAASKEELPFLKSLAKAIHTQFKPTKIWQAEKAQHIESLRLFIATHEAVSKHPTYKESPTPTLFGVPVILLSPIHEYEKNPSLKRALWDRLCQIFR